MSILKSMNAHIWEREANEHYVENRWCSTALFKAVPFYGFIHDPCCGWGRIPEEARARGYIGVTGSDIVDRGFPGCGVEDFLKTHRKRDNFVFNPPFKILRKFVTHACSLVTDIDSKVAALIQTKRLNAAGKWMLPLGLTEIYYLSPRPSMPTGKVVEELMISLGKDPKGDTKDYCWVIFRPRFAWTDVVPRAFWLHRDKGILTNENR